MKQANRNLTMLTDFYEITMANGYFQEGFADKEVTFDMYFRKVPDHGGFAIMAGLQQVIEYLQQLKFTQEDLAFLEAKGFKKPFLTYLKGFQFSCDVWAIPEGTPIFPNEPLMVVRGPMLQAQIIETMLLLCINHQSLIATKANRIVRAAKGRTVMEFGARRAQGADAAIYGARAAYIAGCIGTSNVVNDRDFGIPALGTMAHSWVQMFDTELEAFKAYAREYPENCTLLVDTYDTLKSGIPNAIKAFCEEVLPRGFRPKGIRLDSGDITYLAEKARVMLDDAGFEDCIITASNSLDEYIIQDMLLSGAKVDSFGVGERLITAASDPVFGGVYKLTSVEKDGKMQPRIKLSENVGKITIPGFKMPWRLFDNESGKAIADIITLFDEQIDDSNPYEIFDPEFTWKRKTVTNFTAKPLLVPVFQKGKLVYQSPDMHSMQNYCKQQIATLWTEVKRFENPHQYYVDLSQKVWNMKQQLITAAHQL